MNARRPASTRLRFPFVPLLVSLGAVVAMFGGCALNTHGTGTGGANTGGAPTTCNSAADCDDNEPCTDDTCGDDKICAHRARSTPPVDVQTAGDCKTVVCKNGKATDDPDDSDTFDDGSDCTNDTCVGGEVKNTPKPDGTQCDLNGSTGRCDQFGECKVACKTAADCKNSNPCVTAGCDTTQGICTFTPVSDGTEPSQDVKGDCQISVCMGGQVVSLANDADVPVTTTDCDQDICQNGVPSNPPLALDTTCQTFMGNQTGRCDGAGTCRQCAIDSECGGAIDDCKFNACVNFVCTIGFRPAGTVTSGNPAQNPGDCHTVRCDGAGNTTDDVDDTDKPEDGNVCQDDICTNGNPSHAPHPNIQCGTSGGMPTICNAAGQCGCQGDTDCTNPNTCGGGNPGTPLVCGCTKKTCAQVNSTCGTVTDGCFANQNCNSGSKNGTETDIDCGGDPTTCSTRCAQGKACNVASDCQNGLFCVDGVCCNSACNGTCQACTNAKTGGTTGVCNSITTGSDPDNECSDQGGNSCGTTGVCGNGACAFYPSSTTCAPATCTAGVLTKAKSCNGTGTCVTPNPATQNCAPYVCNGAANACTTTCTNDTQCASGNYCSNGACVPQLAVGGACTGSNQCAMGNCVDGFCCNNACNTACQACSAAKKQSGMGNGSCGAAKVAMADPRSLCGSSPPCGNTGSCAAGGVCEKAASGTNCGAASCTGNQNTPARTCDGSGTCQTVTTTACANNLKCNGAMTTCLANCAGNDNNCVAGYFCNGANVCIDKYSDGMGNCGSNHECESNICGLTNGICCTSSCPDQGAASCGTSGACSGTGACQFYDNTTACSAPSCSGSTLSTATRCNGTGMCTGSVMNSACPGSLNCLNGTQCRASCSMDSHCINNFFCNAGNTCQADKAAGVTCGGDNECASGQCETNCCATSCVSTGTCGVTSCTSGTGDCAYPVGMACGSTCNTSNNKVKVDTCDSNGGCVAGANVDCADFLKCENTTQCWASCLTGGNPDNAKCISGKTCNGTTGKCE